MQTLLMLMPILMTMHYDVQKKKEKNKIMMTTKTTTALIMQGPQFAIFPGGTFTPSPFLGGYFRECFHPLFIN